jgi:hypothetical protein
MLSLVQSPKTAEALQLLVLDLGSVHNAVSSEDDGKMEEGVK